jgi:hypothetical protein
VNEYDNIKYFQKEKFEELLNLAITSEAIISFKNLTNAKVDLESIENIHEILVNLSIKSNFRFDDFISMIKQDEEKKARK